MNTPRKIGIVSGVVGLALAARRFLPYLTVSETGA